MVVALLAYILVVETLLPLLAPTGGRASPGSRLLAWVVSNDPQRGFPVSCDVPRCADPVFSGWGWRASYALGIGAASLLLVVVFLTSRRADWG